MGAVNGLWVFLGFCVFISYLHDRAKLRYKRRTEDVDIVQRLDDIGARVQALEERVANLETVMLEAEKHRRFEHELTAAVSRDSR